MEMGAFVHAVLHGMRELQELQVSLENSDNFENQQKTLKNNLSKRNQEERMNALHFP